MKTGRGSYCASKSGTWVTGEAGDRTDRETVPAILVEAIDDEYNACATYEAVMNRCARI